jgi:hypothetical protein
MRMFSYKSSPLVVRKEMRESRAVPIASFTGGKKRTHRRP